MNDLAPVLAMIVVTWGIYRILELYARRKERMAIIEMLKDNLDVKNIGDQLNLPLFGKQPVTSSWPLRISLLLIGIGIGLLIGFILQYSMTDTMTRDFVNYDQNLRWEIKNTIEVIYFACVSIFGGLGLLIAYFIEPKGEKIKE